MRIIEQIGSLLRDHEWTERHFQNCIMDVQLVSEDDGQSAARLADRWYDDDEKLRTV